MNENPFKHNPLGLNNLALTPEQRKTVREKLQIDIRPATVGDWEKLREIRLKSLTGDDAEMMGATKSGVKMELDKTKEQWQEEILGEDTFSFLALDKDGKAVGIGRARKLKSGNWLIRNGYVDPEFRGYDLQSMLLTARLREIMKRGGSQAIVRIRRDNPVSAHNAEKIGFKKIAFMKNMFDLHSKGIQWNTYKIDLTDEEVIKKINQV